MKYIFGLLLLISSFCKAQTSDWSTYKGSGYAIDYPKSWAIDTSKKMGVDLFMFSAPDSTNDKFRENVNLFSGDFGEENISLDSFVNVSKRQITQMSNDCNILESKQYNQSGKVYHKLEFTATQGIFKLHFVQYYFVKGQKGYTVTFTSVITSFEAFKKIGLQILDSFVLKG
jgi:hypothetical protein